MRERYSPGVHTRADLPNSTNLGYLKCAPIGAIPEENALRLIHSNQIAIHECINALLLAFCLGMGSLAQAADPPSVRQIAAIRPSIGRLILLGGSLAVLVPLFLWHRWRFIMNPRISSSPDALVLTRSALVPQFIQWLKSRLVQELILQREGLLSTQQLAELELARLEQMLVEAHAPLHERLREYEERIASLEQALKLKTDQGAELIETMIRVTRQKLESERGTDLQGTSASVPA